MQVPQKRREEEKKKKSEKKEKNKGPSIRGGDTGVNQKLAL